MLKYTEEHEENIFFLDSNRYSISFIGNSIHLNKFISEKNPDYPDDLPEVYIMDNSHLSDLYADDYILHSYPDQYEITGFLNNNNRHSFLFTELTEAQILIELQEFDRTTGIAIVPNKFAQELAKEIQLIQADVDNNLLDSFRFSWVGFGIENSRSFIEYHFGSFENPSYLILSLSLLLGYLYYVIYHFDKLRYRMKVNTYFGLSTAVNNRYIFLQQLIIFLLSTFFTVFATFIAPNYSIITWQEVYVPIYLIVIFVLSIMLPLMLVARNNRWLEKSRGE